MEAPDLQILQGLCSNCQDYEQVTADLSKEKLVEHLIQNTTLL